MPNRILKESIRESESIDQLSHAAECTWYRLITHVDDYGLFKANIRLVNRALFPLRDYSDSQIYQWLNEVAAAGMVGFYQGEDGKPYGIILNWEQYNRPRNSKPKYPQPTESTTVYDDLQAFENNCVQLHANVPVVGDVVGDVGGGQRPPARKSNQSSKSNGKYPPPPLDDVIEYFKTKGYSVNAAKKAFEYYEAGKDPKSGNWKDAHGNIVKAWKQKMISVWFKPENEARASPSTALPTEEEEKAEQQRLKEMFK